MNASWSPPHSPVPDSLVITPSAVRLLPKDLLQSPWTTECISHNDRDGLREPWSILCTGANSTLHGLRLTTESCVTVIVQDPRMAEQLILHPLRARLLALAHAWNADPRQADLIELIQVRNMMSRAYEHHLHVFGKISGHPEASSGDSSSSSINGGGGDGDVFYLDYVCEGISDVAERSQLVHTLQRAQQRFCEQLNYRPQMGSSSYAGTVGVSDTIGTDLDRVDIGSVGGVCTTHAGGPLLTDGFAQPVPEVNYPLKEVRTENKRQDRRDEIKRPTGPINVQKRGRLPKLDEATFNIRYKTQLCHHFTKHGGHCPAGENCHFAHGPNELHNPRVHPKFRTKLCRNFLTTGSCMFGDACFFRHTDDGPTTSGSAEHDPKSAESNEPDQHRRPQSGESA